MIRCAFAITAAALLLALSVMPTRAQGATPVGSTSGRLTITLIDATGQPVGNARAAFVTEQQSEIASCTTDTSGRCTLDLPNAPADASGFIRGAVEVEGRGRKPVIWPGGTFAISIQLDEAGQLDIPHDIYVTRTPAPTSPYPSVTPRPTRAGGATEVATVAGTATPIPLQTATATPTQATQPPGTASASRLILVGLGLLLVILVGVAALQLRGNRR